MCFKKTLLISSSVGLILSGYTARADELSELRAQVRALSEKVETLSKAQATSSDHIKVLSKKVVAVRHDIEVAPPAKPVVLPVASLPFVPPQFDYPGQRTPFTIGNETMSFTPYGLLSVALTSTSNSAGRSIAAEASGLQQPPRVGGRIYWNLGDKNSALAVLESGFSVTNGTLGQSSPTTQARLFGRQIYGGLSNTDFGTITFGRQYDSVVKTVYWAESATTFAAMGTHVGDNDNLFDTFRLNNDLKYQSPVINNFSLSADYAFSNTADEGDNSAYSAGVLYDGRVNGQGFRAGTAFLQLNHPASSTNPSATIDNQEYGFSSPFLSSPVKKAFVQDQRIAVVGSTYTVGQFTLGGDYSNVKFTYQDASHLNLNNAELFATYYITPKLLAGVGAIYTWGQYDQNGASPNYKQLNTGLDYFFTPNVDIYLVDVFQRAGGSATQAFIYTTTASSTRSQNVLVAGTRLKF